MRKQQIARPRRGAAFALVLACSFIGGSLADADPPKAPPPGHGGPARGKGRFLGPHPTATRPGGKYCYIDVPHMHDYLPDRSSLYQPVGDSQVFTGDPVPFGYQGDKTVYYGHHPVPVTSDGPPTPGSVFCFLRGPHYHGYPSPAQQGYRVEKDVVFYVGPIPPEAARLRPQLEQEQEAEYRPYVAQRPHVVVTPPAEWPGTVWVAPAAAPPPVVIAQPAPPTQVVVVPAAPAQTVVVAPVAPPPTVVVAPVARPAVIVGVPVPGVVVVPGGHPGKGWKHGHFKGKGKGKGHWKHW